MMDREFPHTSLLVDGKSFPARRDADNPRADWDHKTKSHARQALFIGNPLGRFEYVQAGERGMYLVLSPLQA